MGKRSSDTESLPQTYRSPPPLPPPPQVPDSWLPWLTPLIFAVDIAMFVYSLYENDCPAVRANPDECLFYEYLGRYSFQPLKENPLLGPSTTTMIKLGALQRTLVVNGEPWRLFSCMWLHAGVIHLVVNMLSLLFIGIRLEQEFGFFRLGPLYVLSGFGGSLASSLYANPAVPVSVAGTLVSVGASGALFGLLGAMLSELLTNWTIYANKCASLFTLIIVIVLNLALTFIPNVDGSAHIGGFVAGFLLGFILLMRPQFGYVSKKYIPPGYNSKYKKSKYKLYQYILLVSALGILLAGYALGLIMLFNGQTIGRFRRASQ
uniref:RHOMBOID-like protein n=2 Tax=Kalanchoe fedtschenkoi TaxID=63787 RepID=A0A7N0UEA9_KALFE